MAYHVEWYNAPHIVFVKFSGKLTEEDFAGFRADLIALVREVPESQVHTLLDVTEVQGFPTINVVVQQIRGLLEQFPNRNMSTAYGANALVRFIVETLLKFTSLRIRLFDTREDALVLINQLIAIEDSDQKDDKNSA